VVLVAAHVLALILDEGILLAYIVEQCDKDVEPVMVGISGNILDDELRMLPDIALAMETGVFGTIHQTDNVAEQVRAALYGGNRVRAGQEVNYFSHILHDLSPI
jgi:hypothetical protein